jgi:hypothetical protein
VTPADADPLIGINVVDSVRASQIVRVEIVHCAESWGHPKWDGWLNVYLLGYGDKELERGAFMSRFLVQTPVVSMMQPEEAEFHPLKVRARIEALLPSVEIDNAGSGYIKKKTA